MSGSGRYKHFVDGYIFQQLIDNLIKLFFRFFSNSSSYGRGFKISYTESCGGNFSQNGTLVSPNFPQPSGAFECIYEISQTPLLAFNMIQIDKFDLGQGDENCTFNFLEVRDGSDETSPLLGRLCGNLSDNISTLNSTHSSTWLR